MSNPYLHPDRLPPVPSGKGAKFHKSWFESIVARIEHTKPLGEGQSDYSSKGTGPIECRLRPGGDGVDILFNAKVATLNVCSNGAPSTITVFTK
jgi:hypothetical protein